MISLVKVSVGESGIIAEIGTQNRAILGKLLSLGIIPGTAVSLLRKKPAFLLRVGHALVALDKGLAVYILVETDTADLSKSFF